jgi:pyridoxine 4-dehydrogenase
MATLANQAEWDRDFRKLMAVPAAWHGVSAEPLLGSIDIGDARPDWIITGGESGGKRRRPNTTHPRRNLIASTSSVTNGTLATTLWLLDATHRTITRAQSIVSSERPRKGVAVEQSLNKSAALAGTIDLGDLKVNRLGFGAMRLCGDSAWGRPRDRGNANRVLRRAVELGVNFIDTADSYGPETNELLISEALYPYPPDLVIGTKGGLTRPNRRSWVRDGRPEYLRRAIEGSLLRLRLDRIDLYQFHAPDTSVPFNESVEALADLKRAGKIRHIGISNVTVAQLDVARSITPIVSVQNSYNLRDRTGEDVLTECERFGIAFLPWYPLGGKRGLKANKIREVASRRGLSHATLSLAWLLAKSPSMLPIPGTQSIDHLEENIIAAALKLDPEDFDDLR